MVSVIITLLFSLNIQANSFDRLAKKCAPNVDSSTLRAVVTGESSHNPLAININKGKQLVNKPKTKEEAILIVNKLLKDGVNFDAGMGQINSKNMEWLKLSSADLFDSCKNLEAAAKVLIYCYKTASKKFGEGQKSLRAALSCYNTGSLERGFSNGYVKKIVQHSKTRRNKFTVPAILDDGDVSAFDSTQKNLASVENKDSIRDGVKGAFSEQIEDAFQTN